MIIIFLLITGFKRKKSMKYSDKKGVAVRVIIVRKLEHG